MKLGDQMFIRIFKAESELEVWKKKAGRYVLFATYPICHWAGTIGPKLMEGDKQNPEGFYTIGSRQLHRIGRWPRSLNLGYPNSFDRAHNRTGSYILVHGGCSSTGCFAMTNAVMEEIYAMTERALAGGQERIHLHVFPFRMTEANLAKHADSRWIDFWRNLKDGYDAFEATKAPPKVGLCDRRYVVEAAAPGEVGDPGPLALCGVSRAALVEPSPKSLAPLQSLQPWQLAQLQSTEAEELARTSQSASSQPLPAPGDLSSVPQRSQPRQRLAVPLPPAAPAALRMPPPPCNSSLASCRKYLAMPATRIERTRLARAAVGPGRGTAGTRGGWQPALRQVGADATGAARLLWPLPAGARGPNFRPISGSIRLATDLSRLRVAHVCARERGFPGSSWAVEGDRRL